LGEGKRLCVRGERLLKILESSVEYRPEEYVVHVASDNPFLTLVGIILSQNTTDKNAIAALKRFREEVGDTPEKVLEKGYEAVARAIRISGSYRRKAEAIVELARRLVAKGGISYLETASPSELREFLSSVKGIGRKTVDVFLSFTGKEKVFPVDTHARRIAYRWGLTSSPKARYEEVSKALAEHFGENVDYERAHKLIIAFGRKYCRARWPRCEECPLRNCCPKRLEE